MDGYRLASRPYRRRDEVQLATKFGIDRRQGRHTAQVAIAWVQGQQDRLGVPVVPIPGTKRVKWLEQNVAAVDIELTADELAVLDPLADQVVGGRY